jgi:uncharacterized protein YodC (DUF2158 family)
MAFKKGDVVKLNKTIPTGPVIAMRMNEDGVISYLVEWEENGDTKQRWFEENELVAG